MWCFVQILGHVFPYCHVPVFSPEYTDDSCQSIKKCLSVTLSQDFVMGWGLEKKQQKSNFHANSIYEVWYFNIQGPVVRN